MDKHFCGRTYWGRSSRSKSPPWRWWGRSGRPPRSWWRLSSSGGRPARCWGWQRDTRRPGCRTDSDSRWRCRCRSAWWAPWQSPCCRWRPPPSRRRWPARPQRSCRCCPRCRLGAGPPRPAAAGWGRCPGWVCCCRSQSGCRGRACSDWQVCPVSRTPSQHRAPRCWAGRRCLNITTVSSQLSSLSLSLLPPADFCVSPLRRHCGVPSLVSAR